ncbi:hypothetical protein STEG23_008102 [Scotinomys teguina]
MLLNVALLALVLLGAYRLWVCWGRRGLGAGPGAGEESPAATLPRMKKRDFSLEQLRQYDGERTPRILLAVNGKVFDVTKGSKFYGPAGPYGIFAGRDASRGLATFCLDKDALRDEYDDLSDLNAVQMESVREWEMQFKGKSFLLTVPSYQQSLQGQVDTSEELKTKGRHTSVSSAGAGEMAHWLAAAYLVGINDECRPFNYYKTTQNHITTQLVLSKMSD